jgi:hypothetical protein
MQIDHTTKLLLAAIALGLWLNAGVHFIGKAHADDEDASYLSAIETTLDSIAHGTCTNPRLCKAPWERD